MMWFFLKCWSTSSALSGGKGDWCARSAWELIEHGVCLRERYCQHKANSLVFWTSILGWNLLILVLQGYGGTSIWMCCSIHFQSDWAESKACRCHISQVIGAVVMRIFQKMSYLSLPVIDDRGKQLDFRSVNKSFSPTLNVVWHCKVIEFGTEKTVAVFLADLWREALWRHRVFSDSC